MCGNVDVDFEREGKEKKVRQHHEFVQHMGRNLFSPSVEKERPIFWAWKIGYDCWKENPLGAADEKPFFCLFLGEEPFPLYVFALGVLFFSPQMRVGITRFLFCLFPGDKLTIAVCFSRTDGPTNWPEIQ